jgi:hypothetical protein
MRCSRQLQGTSRSVVPLPVGPVLGVCAIDGAPAGFAKLRRGNAREIEHPATIGYLQLIATRLTDRKRLSMRERAGALSP